MNINFSIITVTYNCKKDLLKTIESVQSQTDRNFIHIIKDGLSNDKTDEIIFSNFQNTFFYKSKDKGVYDAMNQALDYAKNEYIIYLNAGDTFYSRNTLFQISKIIKKDTSFNSYIGGTLQIDPLKKRVKRVIGISNLYRYLPLAQLPHPSFIIKKSVLLKLKNPFDSRLKIAGDYKQQLVLREKKLWKTCYLKKIISVMPIGGKSNQNKISILEGYKETFIFSYRIFNLLSIYIILLKLFLNFYSRIQIKKIKHVKIY
tara:strand:+ start:84 stop:860 length:777 start_codon:yes stop_codon:yes gene_type:complete